MLPVFFLLIFAILEFGLLLRTHLTVNSVSSDGARAASVAGSSEEADFNVLNAVGRTIRSVGDDRIDHIVVFKATDPSSTLPAGCETASIVGVCNRYETADLDAEMFDTAGNTTGTFGCELASIDRAWCPDDREDALSAGPDYVGVHIQVRHESATGLVGNDTVVDATKIIRIEPDRI